ncbi:MULTISPECIES: hypothetical protein [Bacillaceae]|uniref:Uncharacterized protein n=1 Tax=Evansella alkalicola TaxID=745819 RepID=A0ABS6JZ32_9BACI|nr:MULTISPECIES: hypothetical protein [Bacillaceae]MBU9723838.1 hypothetical protein [Bacillus alkalicola]
MLLSFEKISELLSSYGLNSRTDSYDRIEFFFRDRQTDTGKRNVVTQVKSLQNGEVNGYVFVKMLREYDGKTTKMGHVSLKTMTESELRALLEKVLPHYRFPTKKLS